MRKIELNFESGVGSCCGVDAIYDFPALGKYVRDTYIVDNTPLTDTEWLQALRGEYQYVGNGLESIAFYTFIHSSSQEGAGTPAKFAAWLKRKKETVVSTKPKINPQTNNKLTMYVWAPSKKFLEKYNKFVEKQEEDESSSDFISD